MYDNYVYDGILCQNMYINVKTRKTKLSNY